MPFWAIAHIWRCRFRCASGVLPVCFRERKTIPKHTHRKPIYKGRAICFRIYFR